MKRSLFLLVLATNFIQAQEKRPIEILKATESINFDGRINEPIWQKATSFGLTRQSPDYGTAPSEKTDFRVFYDNEFLYVGAQLFSSDPKKIQEFSKQRDGSGAMDWIAFALDGYDDKVNGLAFATTPAGNRWDGTVTVTGSNINLSSDWNTYWEVKTSKDSKGWYAEFKIPLSSLRFKPSTDSIVMNFVVWRKITYNNEFSVFPDFQPNWGLLSFANISQGYPILFRGIKNHTPVYLTPYVLHSYSKTKELNTGAGKYENRISDKSGIGADVKYALSPQLTLDATFNTDFAQAEIDNYQVNLTRASLYYPEKREFFLERQNNFSFNFENNNNIFYSRRIGLEASGDLDVIYAGARLTGRIKKMDLGILSMQTEDKTTGGTKNLSLIRFKNQIKNSSGYWGGIFTSSIGKNGSRFYSYGLDGQVELPQSNFLRIAAAKTETLSEAPRFFSLDNFRYNASLGKVTDKGFNYTISHSIVGNLYNPALGFEERPNVTIFNTKIGYTFFPATAKKIFKHTLKANMIQYHGFTSKQKESQQYDFTYILENKDGGYISLMPYIKEEVLANPIVLSSNTSIPKGSYDFGGLSTIYSTATGKPWNLVLSMNSGKFYNGYLYNPGASFRLDGSKILQLQLSYDYYNINFKTSISNFQNHLVSLKSLFTFTTKQSLNVLTQYDYQNNKIGTNIRYRFNSKEGNDLFILLTNINNTNLYRETVPLPFVQSWQIIAKYKYTFKI